MKRGGRRPVGWVESTRVNTKRDWWRQLSVPAKGKTEAELLAFKSKLVPAIAPDGTIEDQSRRVQHRREHLAGAARRRSCAERLLRPNRSLSERSTKRAVRGSLGKCTKIKNTLRRLVQKGIIAYSRQ